MGVNRRKDRNHETRPSCPHARGGEPSSTRLSICTITSCPHARGGEPSSTRLSVCTITSWPHARGGEPDYNSIPIRCEISCPHARGGEPSYKGGKTFIDDRCPHARGGEPIGEAFPGNIKNPPAHPNCRCALVPVVSSERSPAPGTGQERRVVAGQERTFNVMRIGDTRTRLLVPIDFNRDQQTWTPEALEATFVRERAKLPKPLRDTVPEIVLTDERHTTLEDAWAQEYGFEPDQELNRITASTHLGTGSITIYQNSDLQEDPDWQGVLVDLREELGHSIAVHLFGSPEPPQEWITAMQQDSSALGRNPAEDWAQAVALWLAGDLTAYPHREQVLRVFGFRTIKTV